MQDPQNPPQAQKIKSQDKLKWQTIILEWEKSNESQKAFCNRNEININTFTYWRGKLLQKDKLKTAKFIPVSINSDPKDGETCDVILESSNGIKLKIPSTISSEKFRQLLSIVGWHHA